MLCCHAVLVGFVFWCVLVFRLVCFGVCVGVFSCFGMFWCVLMCFDVFLVWFGVF